MKVKQSCFQSRQFGQNASEIILPQDINILSDYLHKLKNSSACSVEQHAYIRLGTNEGVPL